MQSDKPVRLELLRKAAALGPGYKGGRRLPEDGERASLLSEFAAGGIDAPAYLQQEMSWIDRKAKLFEAGDFPDKGVSVGEADLARLVANFDLPVPVLIEHTDSALEMGFLTGVEQRGRELFGTISLTSEANALVERSGAKSLSLGIEPDLSAIREVSLVRNPRVAGARLFNSELTFEATLEPVHRAGAVDWQRKYEAAMREKREREAEGRIAQFMAEGRLTPAEAPYAKALMLRDEAVEFDGDSRPLGNLVAEMLGRRSPHALFGERAPGLPTDYSSHLLLPEEVDFYSRHFPGVSLDEIAKRRR